MPKHSRAPQQVTFMDGESYCLTDDQLIAAQIMAAGEISPDKIAARLASGEFADVLGEDYKGVSSRTISNWKNLQAFKAAVAKLSEERVDQLRQVQAERVRVLVPKVQGQLMQTMEAYMEIVLKSPEILEAVMMGQAGRVGFAQMRAIEIAMHNLERLMKLTGISQEETVSMAERRGGAFKGLSKESAQNIWNTILCGGSPPIVTKEIPDERRSLPTTGDDPEDDL